MLTSYFYFQFDPDLVLVSAGFDSALGDPKVKFFLKTFVHYNYNKTILKDKNSLMKSFSHFWQAYQNTSVEPKTSKNLDL